MVIITTTKYAEHIEMIAHFSSGNIRPCRFLWSGGVYHITEISSTWDSREGAYPLYHYVVRTADEDSYEIHFNTFDLFWTLDYHYGIAR